MEIFTHPVQAALLIAAVAIAFVVFRTEYRDWKAGRKERTFDRIVIFGESAEGKTWWAIDPRDGDGR